MSERLALGILVGFIIVVVIAVILGVVVYREFYHRKVTFDSASISPDGMYRCEVIETQRSGDCETHITIYVSNDPFHESSQGRWKLLTEYDASTHDSAARSNYSIDWEYDQQHRTQEVIVFGDFGTVPFPGKVLYRTALGTPDWLRQKMSTEPAGSN